VRITEYGVQGVHFSERRRRRRRRRRKRAPQRIASSGRQ
jgi:hypothetical protein